MKVVLYGASGMIGSRIPVNSSREAHQVTAVVRNTSKLNMPNVTVRQDDVLDPARVGRGADAMS